ncbi:putative helitron helicase-like domain-containing protein [Helianthus annuus]|nr:putative helitron helicase-like domain-containing protein [Helianthus annuus]
MNSDAPFVSHSLTSEFVSASSPSMHNRRSSCAGVYQDENSSRDVSYWDCGITEYVCPYCKAILWYGERSTKYLAPSNPTFSICCGKGKVVLPLLRHAPQPLRRLLQPNGEPRSKVFKENIKLLNSMFSFTSTGGKVCSDVNDGGGPYTYVLNGHNHHRIGTLLPQHIDGRPRFAQLYIYDTENEVDNRLKAVEKCIQSGNDDACIRSLVNDLIKMLNRHNPLVQSFRMAKERFTHFSQQPVRLRLLGTRRRDARQFNLPTVNEVAALIPGDGNPTDCCDIIVEDRGSTNAKRISELHPSYMSLQYPLLFPYGEDGFNVGIPVSNISAESKRKNVSLRECYCFRLMVRMEEGRTLHSSGRLFLTFVIDAYTQVLEHDLQWYKTHQTTIRSELYNGLHDRILEGETNCDSIVRRVVLPASFTGGLGI